MVTLPGQVYGRRPSAGEYAVLPHGHTGCGFGKEAAEGQYPSRHITTRAQGLPLSTLTSSACLG